MTEEQPDPQGQGDPAGIVWKVRLAWHEPVHDARIDHRERAAREADLGLSREHLPDPVTGLHQQG